MSTGSGPCSHIPAGGGDSVSVKPKVLVISERMAVRESACVLLGIMGCQWVLALCIEGALPSFDDEKPSGAVLDLPSGASDPGSMGHDFPKLLGLLQGKLVVLTDETISREIGDLEKKYSIPFVQRDRLTADLWLCLSAVLLSQPTIRRITQAARLVLDTFL